MSGGLLVSRAPQPRPIDVERRAWEADVDKLSRVLRVAQWLRGKQGVDGPDLGDVPPRVIAALRERGLL